MSFLQPNGQIIDLGVNIDHIASLRNAGDAPYLDLAQAAILAEQAGADTITLRLREDRSHIKDTDVELIRPQLLTRMNLQLARSAAMLDFACRIRPHDVCVVPVQGAELTTDGGVDVAQEFAQVQIAIRQLVAAGIRAGVSIDPDPIQVVAAADAGAGVIALHAGAYACAVSDADRQIALERIRESVLAGLQRGLIVHAGGGLHYNNVQAIAAIPGIAAINVGHAIVARALFSGWQNAVREMKAIMTVARLEGQPK